MKVIFPIFFIFFISKGIAQIVTKTEEFDDGGLKSITYFKKIEIIIFDKNTIDLRLILKKLRTSLL